MRYMQAWEEKYYERQENLKEGLQKGRKLQLSEQVQKKLAKNKTPEEIADALFLSIHTINNHIRNAFQRLDIHNKAEFVRFADLNNLFK